MRTLRTPDEQFAGLADYDLAPHYAQIDDLDGGTLRVHYLDEGPADGDPVLLMHGEPTWAYLYRHMVGPLVAAGHRVIVPDLVGFGRSDKPTEATDYTYARHVEWMRQLLIDRLDLSAITFFGQDWGGLVGLRVVAAAPERYARIVIGNTGLPNGFQKPSKAFMAWQHFSQTVDDFQVGTIINGGCARTLSDAEVAAYNAPFPDDSYKAGARIFPTLVPTSPDDPAAPDNLRAWEYSNGSNVHSCVRSATAIQSRPEATNHSVSASPAPPPNRTPPSMERAISSRRTARARSPP